MAENTRAEDGKGGKFFMDNHPVASNVILQEAYFQVYQHRLLPWQLMGTTEVGAMHPRWNLYTDHLTGNHSLSQDVSRIGF